MSKEKILKEYDEYKSTYEFLAKTVARIVKELLTAKGIRFNSIVERVKDYKSLESKIERKNNKYSDITEITDIAGIRIITYYSDDVDKIADLIKREFNVDIENSIDKRETLDPDRFGYLSLHYVAKLSHERLALTEYSSLRDFKFEIQIRSILQHTWAEIEHDLGYKSDDGIPRDIRRNFSRLAGLLEIADKEFKEIRDKLEIYKQEVREKLQQSEADIYLDDVSLKEFVENDSDIIKLHNMIINLIPRARVYTEGSQHVLRLLEWFHIKTISQLRRFVNENNELACEIAKLYLSGGGELQFNVDRYISILYLGYAELMNNNYSDDQIRSYFKFNHFPGDVDEGLYKLKYAYNIIKNQFSLKSGC